MFAYSEGPMPSRDTKSKLVGESFVIEHRNVLGDIVCRRVKILTEFTTAGVTFLKSKSLSDNSIIAYRVDQILTMTDLHGRPVSIGNAKSTSGGSRKSDRFPPLNNLDASRREKISARVKRTISFAQKRVH
jgi:hypothetical protein